MSRSRWKVDLSCPRCYLDGEAILSHANRGPDEVRVEYLPGIFIAVQSDLTPDHIDILCVRCQVSARRQGRPRNAFWRRVMSEPRNLLRYIGLLSSRSNI